MFTRRYPGIHTRDILGSKFRGLLDIQSWNDESHLFLELQCFEAQYHANIAYDWKATCRYVYQAVASIKPKLKTRFGVTSTVPEWIIPILRLKIYPIKWRDGSKTFTDLSENVFVPNSPRLNPILRDKVDLLDFDGQDIYPLCELLKFTPVKYLSSYDHEENIKLPANSSLHEKAMGLLLATKPFIAR